MSGSATNFVAGVLGSVIGAAYWSPIARADAPEALELWQGAPPLPRATDCWYSTVTSLIVGFNLLANATNRLTLHCAGPDGRAQKVELVDPTSGAILDSQSLSNFGSGTYLTWDVRGPVRARMTSTATGKNAVLQGILLGTASGVAPALRSQPVSSTVATVGRRVALVATVNGTPPCFPVVQGWPTSGWWNQTGAGVPIGPNDQHGQLSSVDHQCLGPSHEPDCRASGGLLVDECLVRTALRCGRRVVLE